VIRRLRVLHRFVFVALALALPALLVAGLRARRHTIPFPPATVSTSDTSGFRLLEKSGLGVRTSSGSIEVIPLRTLTAPDPLLYWSRKDSLGEGAMLLGPLEGMSLRRYSIPESGYLIVYSLGRREIVAADRIELSEGRQ
jgi:hypothetical protein